MDFYKQYEAEHQLRLEAEEKIAAKTAESQAAIQRAEKAEHHERVAQRALSSADCRYAGRVAEMGGSHCPIGEPCDRCAAERREEKLESALAAARKALEEREKTEAEILEAAIDRLMARDDWHTKDIAWHMAFPALFAIIRGEDPSAALNGDSHAE